MFVFDRYIINTFLMDLIIVKYNEFKFIERQNAEKGHCALSHWHINDHETFSVKVIIWSKCDTIQC